MDEEKKSQLTKYVTNRKKNVDDVDDEHFDECSFFSIFYLFISGFRKIEIQKTKMKMNKREMKKVEILKIFFSLNGF